MPIIYGVAVSVYKTIATVQSKQTDKKCCVFSEKPHKCKNRKIPRRILASPNSESICEDRYVGRIGISEDAEVWYA